MGTIDSNAPPVVAPHGIGAIHALFDPIAGESRETCAVAYLDREDRLLGMRHAAIGSMGHVDIPIRFIVGDVIAFDAVTVIMAHNHPSGDPTPSRADIGTTRRLARVLDALGVRLYDHLVLAGPLRASFRQLGLL